MSVRTALYISYGRAAYVPLLLTNIYVFTYLHSHSSFQAYDSIIILFQMDLKSKEFSKYISWENLLVKELEIIERNMKSKEVKIKTEDSTKKAVPKKRKHNTDEKKSVRCSPRKKNKN